jgi:sodium-dependent dicarboxylate transporter 2/3/5
MIIWWITEAISVYATALLPLAILPVMGVLPLTDVAGEYMNPIIVLLLGMFLIALAIERSGLQNKIAFELISLFGYSPKRIIWGFMISTALISTVTMSTTVVLIMLPVAFVILNSLSGIPGYKVGRKFRTSMLLGIAYASSIGSIATLIGAPPNLLFAGTVSEFFDHQVTFVEWSSLGIPLSIVMLAITGVILTRRIEEVPGSQLVELKDVLNSNKKQAGKMTMEQITVLSVLIAALGMMFAAPYWQQSGSLITNPVIAILAGISLFAIPRSKSQGLLGWAEVEKLPFGLLFLLGGGLALSLSFINSGLAVWIAESLSFVGMLPFAIIVPLIIGLIMFMTNIKSNTATAAIFIPVVATMATLNGWQPLPIMFGITVATSLAFLLPMGTPPNALVYEKGKVSVKEMFMNGIILNFIAIALITIFTLVISPLVLPVIPSS